MDVNVLGELHKDYSNQSTASRESAGQAGPGSCVHEGIHTTPESRDRELLAEAGMNGGGQTPDTFTSRAAVHFGSTS